MADVKFPAKILFQARVEDFEVMPSPRIHHSTRWTKRAKAYMAMKGVLAEEFKKTWNGVTITEPVSMTFFIHLPHRRQSDIDNLAKGVMDALQLAEIIKNDSQIIKIEGEVYRKPHGDKKVVVCLRKTQEHK